MQFWEPYQRILAYREQGIASCNYIAGDVFDIGSYFGETVEQR